MPEAVYESAAISGKSTTPASPPAKRENRPNIYCGVGILLFIPLYFMNKKVSFKEKISYLCLIIFFYLSFSTNVLNFIWHGFHYPNSLPCRQSFIYVLFLLAMGYKGFLVLKDRPKKQYLNRMRRIYSTVHLLFQCRKLRASLSE